MEAEMEKDIEEFLETKSDVKDVSQYKKIIPIYYGKTEEEIVQAIEELEVLNTQIKHTIYISPYIKWKYNKAPVLLTKLREDLNISKSAVQKEKTVEPLKIDKETLVKKINELPEDTYLNVQKKFVLKVMADESFVLRGDLINVKYKNYTEKDNRLIMNTIYFKKMNKKGASNESFIVKPETLKLIEKLMSYPESQESDYLLFLKTSDGKVPKIPSDNFCKYIKRISKSVCGFDLGINQYRHLFASSTLNESVEKLKNGEINQKEFVDEIKASASASNHSLGVHLEHYIKPVKEPEEPKEIVEEPAEEPKEIAEGPGETIEEPIYRVVWINGFEIKAKIGETITIAGTPFTF